MAFATKKRPAKGHKMSTPMGTKKIKSTNASKRKPSTHIRPQSK